MRLRKASLALVLSVLAIGFSPIAIAAQACSLKVKAPTKARTFATTGDQGGLAKAVGDEGSMASGKNIAKARAAVHQAGVSAA
jgi:hypothetical protein